MNLPRLSTLLRIDAPAKVAGYYALAGSLWILGTDGLLAWYEGASLAKRLGDSSKGLLFIGLTTGLIYFLCRQMHERQKALTGALAVSQERLEAALESAGDGYWDWDVLHDRMFYSERAKAAFGYSGGELGSNSQGWRERIHPEDRAKVERLLANHLSDSTHRYEAEFRFLCRDGSYKWTFIRGRVIDRDGQDRPARMIGSVMDISVRKAAEMQLSDALEFANAVLRFAPFGIVAYRSDGQAAFANERAAEIIGTDVAGVLRQNFRELESWQRQGLLRAAEHALATGQEAVRRGQFVSTFGRAAWLDAHLVPFQYEGCTHLLVLLGDETAQHQAQDWLHLMQSAAQAAPVGWVLTDTTGRIEWVNTAFCRMTGYTVGETVGQSTRMLRSGRHPPEFYSAIWETLNRGETWAGELINRRKDGSLYHEFNTISPLRGVDGRLSHFVAIKQDVSERKELEQQLARSQRLESIGLLASGIAHDLNNMLSPILLAIGLIKARHPDRETRSNLEMMETAAQRGAGVLRQVLTFARGVEGERSRLEPKPLVKEVAQLAEETFPRQIRVSADCPPGLHAVMGDLTQLHQVLLNLAVNARDAMPEGGLLVLYARNAVVDEAQVLRQVTKARAGDYVVLGVRDSGSGIAPDVVEHMFEPFFTTKPRGRGSGLGLSTVFGIVRSHCGFIEVVTEPGCGTDMRVYLPAVPSEVHGSPSAGSDDGVLEGAGRKLLVVDDEGSIRDVTCAVLEGCGFRTVSAGDGVDALDRFREDPGGFAAAIVDLMMPRLNGYSLVREIRAVRPDLPIVACSGMSSNSPTEDAKEILARMGVSVLLCKPYTGNELLAALKGELSPPAVGEAEKKG